MSTATIITTTTTVIASTLALLTAAEARSGCTPQHLLSTLRQVEAKCGGATVVSDHRPGARIAGTNVISQHAFCNGSNGAIDAVFKNRACALSALRQTRYTVLTYGNSAHIHVGTDGWSSGHGRQVAQHQGYRGRLRFAQRAATRVSAHSRYGGGGWDDWSHSSNMTW